ncbi:hypothetical protein GGR34_002822 [Microvirga flocculans]|uniref:Uncharacterized protein n=1 Tax=Microvirga flocculans TaxID=217168 RepID=A0A7W6IHU7_9HYPH|nr:hypothetical protein [Microvirga flocculans]MBB4041159.1 hypothetical protein [Microvirga flocculans]
MADYYPLIARAVEGLPEQTPDKRHAVYERARTALVAQLRSLNPPLTEPEIQRESRSLDEAIARVEADYAAPAGFDADAFASVLADDRAAHAMLEASRGAASVHGLRAPAPEPAPEVEAAEEHALSEPVVARPKIDSRPHPAMQNKGRMRTVIFGSVLALVIAAIAAFAFMWRDKPENLAPETPAAEAQPPAPADSKINERVGGQAPPAGAPAARQQAGAVQRAVFYEEDPANPQTPRALVGRVVWRFEDMNPGQGQSLERAVIADVDIPDAGLTMKMVLRRNLDTTLPASHTVELTFTTRQGDMARVIRDVGLLQFKSEEAARGTPVAGLPVPVRENLFLIGLSNLESDVVRNTQLFVRRNWIDLPVRMASGQRAILSFEKGGSGEQILNDAFSRWQ